MSSTKVRIFTLILSALAGSFLSLTAAADYLSAELRQRVEDLKQSARTTVTTPANIDQRARTLLEWANVYSLEGGITPVELPLNAGMITE